MNEKSRPKAASQDLAAELIKIYSVTLIGASVEKQLDAALWRLESGEIGLQDLTGSLRAWYTVGYDAGRASCQATIDRLSATCDRLYGVAFGPKLRIDPNAPTYAELERRRGHAERAEQIERDLAAMFAGMTS